MSIKNIVPVLLALLMVMSCNLFKVGHRNGSDKGDVDITIENGIYVDGVKVKDLSYAFFFDYGLTDSYYLSSILFHAEKYTPKAYMTSKDKIADANWSVFRHDGDTTYILKIFQLPGIGDITATFDSDGGFIKEKSDVTIASFDKGRPNGGTSIKASLTAGNGSIALLKYSGPVDVLELF